MQRNLSFWPLLCCVQDVEAEVELLARVKDLDVNVPRREDSRLYLIMHLSTCKAATPKPYSPTQPTICTRSIMTNIPKVLLSSLLILEALYALSTLPIIANKLHTAGRIHPLISVDTPSVFKLPASRDANIVKEPGEHVQGLWEVAEVVPDSPPLLHTRLWIGLKRSDHLWEADAIADEEDWEVEPDDIVVSFLSVVLHSETSRVAKKLWGAQGVNDSTPPTGDWRLLSRLSREELCHRSIGPVYH
mmetsp:Transcript_2751/g.10023  ORF Transcript_2751/g.10023 Transcript_2751/m.10023 type:complete len:246 (-) Transcript_2751:293-1030(-)